MKHNKILLSFTFFLLVASILADTPSEIFLGQDQEPGFITISDQGEELFYWLFRSRRDPDSDPLVFWLTGGPGCASELAAFYENGPFRIQPNLTLVSNPYSWTNVSNMVYIDQPLGTGFSDSSILTSNEGEIASDFYTFLVGFYQKYPEFANRALYLAGESYAGHYIPAISSYILKQGNSQINLKGISIGDGFVDPYIQFPEYATYAYQNNLISNSTYQMLKLAFSGCDYLINAGPWNVSFAQCLNLQTFITGVSPYMLFNVYNIKEPCIQSFSSPPCYNFTLVADFLGRADVIQALGVQARSWTLCDAAVHTDLLSDYIINYAGNISYLIEQEIFVFIYNGDQDFICNWLGGQAWTNAVQWSGQSQFQNATYQNWGQDDTEYGQYKIVDNFAFVRVYNAGHMVPMDQPKAALYLFENFLSNWENI